MLLADVNCNVVEDVNVLKIIFRVLRFLNSNLRNLKPCKIQAFSHSFHARKYSINGQFPQILWKCAKNSAETVFLENVTRIVY